MNSTIDDARAAEIFQYIFIGFALLLIFLKWSVGVNVLNFIVVVVLSGVIALLWQTLYRIDETIWY